MIPLVNKQDFFTSIILDCNYCHVAGTLACSALNGICECADGYQGYNCEECALLYLKDDFNMCQG